MLTEELMKKVRQLEIRTSRAVDEAFAGRFSSAFKGRGMEFAEVRAYQPGDDVRSIDWNVTARSGEPHVKRFIEERELTVVLVVDLSASGSFGSVERAKNETAAELCAVLAFAATRSNDKVGLLVFTDHVELFVPPKKGRNHVLRLIRELLEFTPARVRTDPVPALEHLRRVVRRRAVVFFVSDFLFDFSEGGRFALVFDMLARRHDVIAVRLTDPREREMPAGAGLIELEDAETGARRVVDASSRRVRRAYAAAAADRERALEKRLRRLRVDRCEVVSGEPYVHALAELFRRRERRR